MKEINKMQIDSKSGRISTLFAFLAVIATLTIPAFAINKTKPTVAIIRAEWCSACQKLEPTMMELMKQYGDRLNFVVLDVSTEEKTAASAATARRLGLERFFEENKRKTSTVAVFIKGSKPLFQTATNFDREAYVRAFDDAIAKAGK